VEVKIVTDTLSDIPTELAQELGITIVPLNLHFGTEIYRDKVDISTEEFYKRLVEGNVFPTTSAPPPGIFVELFAELAKETNEILAIMTSSKFSAIHESALQATGMVELDCTIEVIDSSLAIGGLMIAVIAAAKAARAGNSLVQISDMVKQAIPRTHTRMAFDTLEYLRRGGRIGKAQALLGGLLKVNPILAVKNGEVMPITRARNRNQAMDYLIEFARGFPQIAEIVVEDATTSDEAEMLVERLGEIFPKEGIYRAKASPVVGTHVGPHVLAVSVLEGDA